MTLRLWGLRVEVSYPLAAAMALILIYDTSMSAAVCLAAVTAHEGGHLLMLYRFGSFPKTIRLTLFDIAIVDSGKALRSPSRELAVTLAGIVSNLIFGFVSLAAGRLTGNGILDSFAAANFSLAAFNSLPAQSLDGGQALLLLLCRKLSPDRAFLILDIISLVVLIPCAVFGFLVLLRSRWNFSLLVTSMYLIALVLLRRSCKTK